MGNKLNKSDKQKQSSDEPEWLKIIKKKLPKEPQKPKEPGKSQNLKLTWYATGQPYPLEFAYANGQDIIEGVLCNIFDNFDYNNSSGIFKLKPIQVHETPPGIVYKNDKGLVDKNDRQFGSHACMLRCLQAMVEVKYQRAFTVQEIVDSYNALVGPTKEFAIVTNHDVTCLCQKPWEIIAHMLKLINRPARGLDENARYCFKTECPSAGAQNCREMVCSYNVNLVEQTITRFKLQQKEPTPGEQPPPKPNMAIFGVCGIEIPSTEGEFLNRINKCDFIILGWDEPAGYEHYVLLNKNGQLIFDPWNGKKELTFTGLNSIRFWTIP